MSVCGLCCPCTEKQKEARKQLESDFEDSRYVARETAAMLRDAKKAGILDAVKAQMVAAAKIMTPAAAPAAPAAQATPTTPEVQAT